MRPSVSTCLPVLSVAVALSISDFALAQSSAGSLEEVIVSATKRDENLQDIPVAVSAISAAAMDSQGLANIRAIAQQVPNLNWGEHFGTTMVSIRGVGSIVDSGVTEPTVALYVDNVFLPRSTMATLRTVDLERIEVLRGPQGTLYGRNATGGAINFISAAPTESFEAGINLSAGSRDGYGVSGYVSGPLAENIYARISAGHEYEDGYVKVNGKPKLGGVDVKYARAALRVDFSDDVTLDLTARFEQNEAPNVYQQYLGSSLIAGPGQYTTEPYKIIANRPYTTDVDTLVTAATLKWDLSSDLSLTSITSYVDHSSEALSDSDGSSVDFNYVPGPDGFERQSESFGQELTLAGDYDKVSWLVGAFFYKENSSNFLPVTLGEVGGPASGLPVNTLLLQGVKSEISSESLYGDMTLSMTERLRLNLGLRYNHEDQEHKQYFGIPAIGIGPLVAPLDASSSKLLPKVGMQFDLADMTNVYVQWSKGFKGGGPNLAGGGGESFANEDALFGSEEIDAYEIGIKSQLLDGRLVWNSAAFYYDYEDMQATTNIPPSVTFVSNADVKVYGMETEVNWSVTGNLNLNASLTLLKSRFEDDDYAILNSATGQIENLDGKPVPHSPDYTVNVGGDYRVELGGDIFSTLTFRGNIYHTDDVVLRQFSGPGDVQSAYTLVNLSAELADSQNRTRLSFFVNNATDREYKQHVLNFGVGSMGNYAPPRTWGVTLSRDF